MRDRLRAVECPIDMIGQIGGWKTVGGVGVNYGKGYAIDQLSHWIKEIKIIP